jgi:hypothetical protein
MMSRNNEPSTHRPRHHPPRRTAAPEAATVTDKPKKAKTLSKAKRHATIEHVSIFGVTERFGPLGLILYAEFS